MNFFHLPSIVPEEILFSRKRKSPYHPPLYFRDKDVNRVNDHTHLGLILDSKLTFAKHINEKVAIARKWIGIIKHLRPYLPLKALDQIYKMHIRPHFDYCDIIYHIPVIMHEFNSSLTLNYQMNILEKTQYQAALAISGAWKGTNTDKIYEELGWESLDQRRFFRRLTMFYKIINNLTPDYLRKPILSQLCHRLRSTNVNVIPFNKERGKNSFYPDAANSWNNIGNSLRKAASLQTFKTSLLKIIRPTIRETFNIHDPNGIKWIFQLRVGLSPLKEHKKRHRFLDTPDDVCVCTREAESTRHFFLECSLHVDHRLNLLNNVEPILILNDLENIHSNGKVRMLLYGHESFTYHENKKVLKSTINFIRATGRFSTELEM